nr:FAD-dependent oxidoreductase [Lentzea indica]
MGKHRVVVVGGGFGGLGVVRGLKRADAEVTLIDRTNHHLFQPLLYQVATALLPSGDIAPAFRAILRKQRNARVLLGEVTGFDAANRRVHVTCRTGRHARSSTTRWSWRQEHATATSGTTTGRSRRRR